MKQSEKKKGTNPSVSELDRRLSLLPYTSDEYKKILKVIQKQEKNVYGDQHILCIKAAELRSMNIKTSHLHQREMETLCSTLMINDFSEKNHISSYEPRYMVEYDYKYKQVLTFGYITNHSRTQFVLLRKNDSGRVGMIGGHVDFDPSVYAISGQDFLLQNFWKELFEEVEIFNNDGEPITTKSDLGTTTIQMVVNENTDHYRLRNIGLIYEVRLPVENLTDHYKFGSNEPKEHSVEFFTRDEIIDCQRYHSMLKHIVTIIKRYHI